MTREVSGVCVEFVYLVLLIVLRAIVYFIESSWIQLLLVKVDREFVFILLEVVLCLLYVIRAVHDLEFNLQASLLLLEIAECDAPNSSTKTDRITLLVEVIRDVVDSPNEERSGKKKKKKEKNARYSMSLVKRIATVKERRTKWTCIQRIVFIVASNTQKQLDKYTGWYAIVYLVCPRPSVRFW